MFTSSGLVLFDPDGNLLHTENNDEWEKKMNKDPETKKHLLQTFLLRYPDVFFQFCFFFLFTVVNVQLYFDNIGSQLGIHKVIGTLNTD